MAKVSEILYIRLWQMLWGNLPSAALSVCLPAGKHEALWLCTDRPLQPHPEVQNKQMLEMQGGSHHTIIPCWSHSNPLALGPRVLCLLLKSAYQWSFQNWKQLFAAAFWSVVVREQNMSKKSLHLLLKKRPKVPKVLVVFILDTTNGNY